MAIDPSYVSPGLRWGLLLDDHPGAVAEYQVVTAREIPGGHPFANPDEEFILCTISFPSGPLGSTKASAYGWKPLSEARKPDDENFAALRTKALGRALKDAGYPDKFTDLKALMLWRRRQAEISAIAQGHTPELEERSQVEGALAEAAETESDSTGYDEGDYESEADPQVVDAEVVESDGGETPVAPVDNELDKRRSEMWEVLKTLDPDVASQLMDQMESQFGAIDVQQPSTWGVDVLDFIDAWMNS